VTALPCPLLTGAGALRAEVPWVRALWIGHFLDALAEEAEDGIALMATLERQWFAARAAVAERRRDSRAAAVDILAPLVSATTLGQALGMTINNATRLLEEFVVLGITSEVTHRSKRRLYGLKHLAPLRETAARPRRPLPGRRPGRPSGAPFPTSDANEGPAPTASVRPASPPVPPLERREYSPTVMRDHEYKRCGTLTLMAGTDLLTGHVHALVKERHRSREFIEFLKLLDTVYPADTAIEVILDNHSAPLARDHELACRAAHWPLYVHLHADAWVMAQCHRGLLLQAGAFAAPPHPRCRHSYLPSGVMPPFRC